MKTGETLEEAYNNIALRKGIKTIGDIKNMPLVIPAVDVKMCKEYVFTNNIPENCKDKSQYITDISVGKAVRASSSFPVVFSPCEIGKHKFLDGGTLNNVPTSQVRKLGADKVISINFDADEIDDSSNIMDIVMKTLDIMGNKISEKSLQRSDLIITVPSDKTGLLDIEKIDKCYNLGYETAIRKIEEIKNLIKD